MIFLVVKIFVYLLLALLAGGAAGWILRHVGAAKQDEEMRGTLADARARVPHFESLIRSRDEQIRRLKEDLKDKDVRINALIEDAREMEHGLKEKVREAQQLAARHQAREMTAAKTASEASAGRGDATHDPDGGRATGAVELEAEVERLEQELADARARTAEALAEVALASAKLVTLEAQLERAGAGGGSEPTKEGPDLEARLRQKAEDCERLAKELDLEQRRILELERERELQNKSLQVLHQQLELERERSQRAASG